MPRSGDRPQINIQITPDDRRIIKGVKHARQFDSDAETVRYLIRTHPDALGLTPLHDAIEAAERPDAGAAAAP